MIKYKHTSKHNKLAKILESFLIHRRCYFKWNVPDILIDYTYLLLKNSAGYVGIFNHPITSWGLLYVSPTKDKRILWVQYPTKLTSLLLTKNKLQKPQDIEALTPKQISTLDKLLSQWLVPITTKNND
jgi:hypothetical protein